MAKLLKSTCRNGICLEESGPFRRQCARGWSSWWRRGGIIQATPPETRGGSFMHVTSIYRASTVCFSHLSRLYPGLFPTQPGRLWVCFHETASPLHHRLGPGHLLGRPVWESAYSAWPAAAAAASSPGARRSWHECSVPFGPGPLGPSPGGL